MALRLQSSNDLPSRSRHRPSPAEPMASMIRMRSAGRTARASSRSAQTQAGAVRPRCRAGAAYVVAGDRGAGAPGTSVHHPHRYHSQRFGRGARCGQSLCQFRFPPLCTRSSREVASNSPTCMSGPTPSSASSIRPLTIPTSSSSRSNTTAAPKTWSPPRIFSRASWLRKILAYSAISQGPRPAIRDVFENPESASALHLSLIGPVWAHVMRVVDAYARRPASNSYSKPITADRSFLRRRSATRAFARSMAAARRHVQHQHIGRGGEFTGYRHPNRSRKRAHRKA